MSVTQPAADSMQASTTDNGTHSNGATSAPPSTTASTSTPAPSVMLTPSPEMDGKVALQPHMLPALNGSSISAHKLHASPLSIQRPASMSISSPPIYQQHRSQQSHRSMSTDMSTNGGTQYVLTSHSGHTTPNPQAYAMPSRTPIRQISITSPIQRPSLGGGTSSVYSTPRNPGTPQMLQRTTSLGPSSTVKHQLSPNQNFRHWPTTSPPLNNQYAQPMQLSPHRRPSTPNGVVVQQQSSVHDLPGLTPSQMPPLAILPDSTVVQQAAVAYVDADNNLVEGLVPEMETTLTAATITLPRQTRVGDEYQADIPDSSTIGHSPDDKYSTAAAAWEGEPMYSAKDACTEDDWQLYGDEEQAKYATTTFGAKTDSLQRELSNRMAYNYETWSSEINHEYYMQLLTKHSYDPQQLKRELLPSAAPGTPRSVVSRINKLKRKRKRTVATRGEEDRVDSLYQDDCNVCNNGGELLCCDVQGCNRAYHMECLHLMNEMSSGGQPAATPSPTHQQLSSPIVTVKTTVSSSDVSADDMTDAEPNTAIDSVNLSITPATPTSASTSSAAPNGTHTHPTSYALPVDDNYWECPSHFCMTCHIPVKNTLQQCVNCPTTYCTAHFPPSKRLNYKLLEYRCNRCLQATKNEKATARSKFTKTLQSIMEGQFQNTPNLDLTELYARVVELGGVENITNEAADLTGWRQLTKLLS